MTVFPRHIEWETRSALTPQFSLPFPLPFLLFFSCACSPLRLSLFFLLFPLQNREERLTDKSEKERVMWLTAASCRYGGEDRRHLFRIYGLFITDIELLHKMTVVIRSNILHSPVYYTALAIYCSHLFTGPVVVAGDAYSRLLSIILDDTVLD